VNVARLVLALALVIAFAGCEREFRRFSLPPGAAGSAPDPLRATSLRPGTAEPVQRGVTPGNEARRYEENAYEVSQGKRLFRWYNCNGCHAQGGGGMGPPLMDAKWLYGSTPQQIFQTIVEGRPNGMPAFGGRIPEDQLWQIVAYVRSMSGQLREDVAPGRSDGISAAPPENTRREAKPVRSPPFPPVPRR